MNQLSFDDDPIEDDKPDDDAEFVPAVPEEPTDVPRERYVRLVSNKAEKEDA